MLLLVFPLLCEAQVDADIVRTEAEFLILSSDTDSDPTKLAVSSNGATRYVFEDEPGTDSANDAWIIDVDEQNSRLVVWINGTGLATVGRSATLLSRNELSRGNNATSE